MSEAATTLHAEITELCQGTVLADRLRAALVVSGCTVARAQGILELSTIANALAADDQLTDTRTN
jgi:hypothetical protein